MNSASVCLTIFVEEVSDAPTYCISGLEAL